MNAATMLENGNLMVIQAVDNLNDVEWDMPGVCEDWSVKDIVAHLTSYEKIVVDVLTAFQQGGKPTPYVLRWLHQPDEFNREEVEA